MCSLCYVGNTFLLFKVSSRLSSWRDVGFLSKVSTSMEVTMRFLPLSPLIPLIQSRNGTVLIGFVHLIASEINKRQEKFEVQQVAAAKSQTESAGKKGLLGMKKHI